MNIPFTAVKAVKAIEKRSKLSFSNTHLSFHATVPLNYFFKNTPMYSTNFSFRTHFTFVHTSCVCTQTKIDNLPTNFGKMNLVK